MKDTSPSLRSLSSKPRQYLNNVILTVIGGANGLKSAEGFSLRENCWSSLCEPYQKVGPIIGSCGGR